MRLSLQKCGSPEKPHWGKGKQKKKRKESPRTSSTRIELWRGYATHNILVANIELYSGEIEVSQRMFATGYFRLMIRQDTPILEKPN